MLIVAGRCVVRPQTRGTQLPSLPLHPPHAPSSAHALPLPLLPFLPPLPPPHVQGHNKCVDWWALGILIFEMLAGYPPFYDESPFGIYQKILAGKLEFPKHFAPEARDLIRKLLTADKTKRLGACSRDHATMRRSWPRWLHAAVVLAAWWLSARSLPRRCCFAAINHAAPALLV